MPSRAALAEILRQLLHAESSHARLWHDGCWLLRYRDRIDAATELPAPLEPVWFRWTGEPLLQVAGQQFLFHRRPPAGPALAEGVDAGWLAGADVLMDSARSSDRLRVGQGGHQRSWKNLVQEHGVAPWARAALPLLRQRGGILYAAPFGMNRRSGAGSGNEAGDGNADGRDAAADRIVIEWCAPPGLARWL
jgi:tRNA(Ile)-lysidine synthetase-like protein